MENPESNEDVEFAAASRARQLAALSHHLIKLAEAEKAALARRLHDELGACLTVVALDVSVVAEKIKETEPDLALRLQRAIARVKEAVTLKRHIVEALRPSMLDSLGLSACLGEHALDFTKRTGLPVATDICREFDGLDSALAMDIFRIAQESLRNIERHAGANRAWLFLQPQDGGACLRVEDDGAGIEPGPMLSTESLGLIGMRERVALHGGRLEVRRRHPESGTIVEAWFPRPAD